MVPNILSYINIATVMLLILLEVVHLSAIFRRYGTKRMHKSAAHKQRVCVGATWISVGKYRFWQRVACAQRRNENVNHTMDEDIADWLPSEEEGPKRNATYDPNYGHEPYWADGGWVFDKLPTKEGDKYMCGVRCSKMFLDYGTICARNIKFQLATFANYCAMKNYDCSGKQNWVPVYRGECYRDLELYYHYKTSERAKLAIQIASKRNKDLEPYVGLA